MKKLAALLVAIVIGGTIVGCSEKSTSNTLVGKETDNQNQEPLKSPTDQSPPNDQNNQTSLQNGQGNQDPNKPVSSPTLPRNDVIEGWNTPGGKSLADRNLKNDAYEIIKIEPLKTGYGFKVIGKLRAFEAVGAAVLKGPDGKAIVQPGTNREEIVIKTSKGAPEWGDFVAEVKYPETMKGKVATLEFFVHSAKDGSKQQVLSVKIQL